MEDIPTLMCHVLKNIDTAIHHADHPITWAWPPVAVTFGGLVASQGERGKLIDNENIPHPLFG
jgi:hypothetical protein